MNFTYEELILMLENDKIEIVHQRGKDKGFGRKY